MCGANLSAISVIQDFTSRLSGSSNTAAAEDEDVEGEPIPIETSNSVDASDQQAKNGFKKVGQAAGSPEDPDDLDGEAMDIDGEELPISTQESAIQPQEEDLDGVDIVDDDAAGPE